ncbi:Trm112 family protein [Isoptericola sp. NPDC055881]
MSDSTSEAPTIDPWVRSILRCPVTGAELVDAVGPDGEQELRSTDPERPLAYPVRDGIPVLLESDARPL